MGFVQLESFVISALRQFAKSVFVLFGIGLLAACTTGFESNRHNIPLTSLTKARLSQMGSSEGAPNACADFQTRKRIGSLEASQKKLESLSISAPTKFVLGRVILAQNSERATANLLKGSMM